jgi:hypothetical protein
MAGHANHHLDEESTRELEAARQQHLATLRGIPLEDKELFAAACARHEARIESILQAAAERRAGNGQAAGSFATEPASAECQRDNALPG